MKRLALASALLLVLSACSTSSATSVDWEVPLTLTASQYEQGATVPVSATESSVVVTTSNDDGFHVRGYDSESGEGRWDMTVTEFVQCTAKNALTLCSPTAAEPTSRPFLVDLESGEYEYVEGVYSNFYALPDAYYLERPVANADNLVELVAVPGITALDVFLDSATQVATLDTSTGEVDDLGNSVILDLAAAGELAPDSHWHGRVAPVAEAAFLADGYMTATQASNEQGTGTGVVLYDDAGEQVESRSINASLHYTHNPAWTLTEVQDILDRAEELATEFPHVMVFQTGQTFGFKQVTSDTVAPAYANIESYSVSNGVDLDFKAVSPESQTIWVYQYPYVTMSGTNDDGVFARTYDVTDGATVLDNQKCQWQHDATFCFDGESLSKVSFE